MAELSRIVFINRVYPPELAATGQLLADLAEGLAARGWRVTVVTSRTPGCAALEVRNGVEIRRVRALGFTRSSNIKRALCYLALYPTLLRGAWGPARNALTVTLTDPPLQVVLSLPLKWFRGARPVHWAQDIYPELAEEFGVIGKGSLLARLLRFCSSFALRRQSRIIVVGECMKERLARRKANLPPVEVIPNWALGSLRPAEASALRQKHGLENRFIVMYSGNFGLAHSFSEIMEAVKKLSASPRLAFVFVGDGPALGKVKEQLHTLSHVTFLPLQEPGQLAQTLSLADLHLVSVAESAAGLIVPSKIYGILAVGRPFVYIGPAESEAARAIARHGCGAHVPTGDSAALVREIATVSAEPTLYADWLAGVQRAQQEAMFTRRLSQFEELLAAV